MDHRPADSLPRRFRLTRPHAKRPALPSPYFSPTSTSLHPIAHPPHKSHPSYRSHFPRRPSTLPMPGPTPDQLRAQLDIIYRTESRRILATLIRLLGDFELAEDALHDAFSAALEQWPVQGIPANPRAWLVSAGRFKVIDAIRRRARFEAISVCNRRPTRNRGRRLCHV
jgi:hypothetical protein